MAAAEWLVLPYLSLGLLRSHCRAFRSCCAVNQRSIAVKIRIDLARGHRRVHDGGCTFDGVEMGHDQARRIEDPSQLRLIAHVGRRIQQPGVTVLGEAATADT